ASAPAAMAFMVSTMVISWVCGSGAVRMVTSRFGVSAAAAPAMVRASSGATRRIGFIGISFFRSLERWGTTATRDAAPPPRSPTGLISHGGRNLHSHFRIYAVMKIPGQYFRDILRSPPPPASGAALPDGQASVWNHGEWSVYPGSDR